MLQARLFNYADAQRYRLGVNYQQIPVNKPRCPVHSNHRDGQGRIDANYGSLPHYEPNSFSQWQEQPQYKEPPLKITGDAAYWDYRQDDADYFSQPRALFALMNTEQKQVLFENTARAMGMRWILLNTAISVTVMPATRLMVKVLLKHWD